MMLDIKLISAVLAIIIVVGGAFLPYIRDIFLKKTKPHAYTWLIWTITQGTALAGLWYGKGGWGALSVLIGTIFVFFIFFLSLKYGTKNITKIDTVVFIGALSAVVVWWQLHNPLLAILMVSAIDAIGYLPSFRKTFYEPWSETIVSWIMFSIANIFTVIALTEYNALTLTYLITITACNIVLLLICLTRRKIIPVTL